MKRFFVALSLLSLCLFLNLSCKPTTASIGSSKKYYKYEIKDVEFDLGDSDEFEYSDVFAETDENGRLLVPYRKKRRSDEKNLGTFFRLSEDSGKTFGKEYNASEILKFDEDLAVYAFQFIPNGFAANIKLGKNFFYTQSIGNLENWSDPVQVNDEQDSVFGNITILHKSANEVFTTWIDTRRGFDLIFFSRSIDGGKTWSANQPIDYDFREGGQQYGKILLGENGRLHAIWQDWRDRKTLVDIRYSYSDDDGENWSESIKINDDEKEVWQFVPNAVVERNNIYVAFSDFREKGEEDDNDWNIYLARSDDNGATWKENKRLNDVKEGIDGVPFLALDKEGKLFCLWESGRETVFGQIVFSYSNDKGETWSPSVAITSSDEIAVAEYTALRVVSADKLFIRTATEVLGKKVNQLSFLIRTDDVIDPGNEQEIKSGEITPKTYTLGETLFADDFSTETADNWEVESGVWDIVGGTYMGVYPNSRKTSVTYAKIQEPERYVFQGRFRLDAVAHVASMLHFRASSDGQQKYTIVNHFRIGTWLSLKDGDQPAGSHVVAGTPLVQKRFPFRQDRWYKFTIVITPDQIDYYVEGRLMFSYKGDLTLPKGKIGIGGYTHAPTYFDDITVSELK